MHADRITPTIGVTTPLDDDSYELVTSSDFLDEVALYVGLLGHDVITPLTDEEISWLDADAG